MAPQTTQQKPAPQQSKNGSSSTADAARTQDGRLISVQTSLGKDVLLLTRFSGTEAISGIFQFKLDVLVDKKAPANADVLQRDKDIQALVGKEASVTVLLKDGNKRFFHGVVSRVLGLPPGGPEGRFLHYVLELVPWIWLLTQRTNSRIFPNKKIPEIVEDVFNQLAEADNFKSLVVKDCTKNINAADHVPLDYCVQYQESDFNFVSRLMEQEGLSYYFDFTEEKKHKLVLFDDSRKANALPWSAEDEKSSTVDYVKGDKREEGKVTDWRKQTALEPGTYTSRDYYMQLATQPDKALEESQTATDKSFEKLEIYDYSTEYAKRFVNQLEEPFKVAEEGRKLAAVRMDEQELPKKLMAGSLISRIFASGHKFKLQGHPTDNDTYVLTSVKYNIATDRDYISDKDASSQPSVQFVCVPQDVRIRPLRTTPKPLISGPQTARVAVAVQSGEESHLDKFGRVRVQFHWDREGKNDDNSSCWVRVAQPWAGSSQGRWGAYFWPRVGDEVVVEFMEGDPDQPIVTGSVFNAQNMPIYDLPGNYTRSGIQTRSSKGGTTKNFNELRFEDKIGQEQIFINAERDMDHRVEHDYRTFVGADMHLAVSGLQNESVGGDHSRHVTGSQMEQIDKKFSLQVGGAQHQTVGTVYTLQAGDEIHLKAGTKIVIEAGQHVSLIGPGGFVDIGPGGVTIKGLITNINSGGSPASGTAAAPDGPQKPDTADDGSKGTKLQ